MIVTCHNCGTRNRVDETAARSQRPLCGQCGAPLAADSGAANSDGDKPIDITDANFEQVLSSAGEKPLLIDFWASWCPPCRLLAPTIDAIAAESGGRYVVGKLDTDANQTTAGRFNLTGIPTMLIFKRGELVDRIVGLAPKQTIAARLERHI